MNKQEVVKIIRLLTGIHGKASARSHPDNDEDVFAAWRVALKEVSYEEARAAVLRRARDNEYFPSVAELMQYIPVRRGSNSPKFEDEWERRGYEMMLREHAALEARCRESGIPTLLEAKEQGMTTAEWMRLADEKGV